MRIAILNRDRCQPVKCSTECIKFCPRVRTGDETIVMGEDNKVIISEELCIGCGICVNKCPFDSINIIGLPEALTQPTHRYGQNGFALYGLPVPQKGKVTGILGPNGIGKTTAVQILSGLLKPNLGRDATWDEVLEYYAGSAMHEYLEKVGNGGIKVSQKPQYIDRIPKSFSGTVSELLEAVDEKGILDELTRRLSIDMIMDRNVSDLSGGELQRVALTAAISKKADFYFFDEISPYMDIYQRINAARLIQEVAQESSVIVVEHDLAMLDLLADTVHIAYGTPAGYGVITHPKSVRVGINEYLKGFLPEENVRIRPYAIEFEMHAPRSKKNIPVLMEFGELVKDYSKGEKKGFKFTTKGGQIRRGSVVGVVGPNGIGKTTFVKILAGVIEPTVGKLDAEIKISYKPQYLKADITMRVQDLLRSINSSFDSSYYQNEILNPLQLTPILDNQVTDLSGGELQRVAIAACLSKNADMYILDEPSAHLDVEQRALATTAIRRFAENHNVATLVVDHDIYMIDLLSEELMVFEGTEGIHGDMHGPYTMRDGMNHFLRNLDTTFRRDGDTRRPRVNKTGSRLDREQKSTGDYYYMPEE